MPKYFSIDELEADLGQRTALGVLANCGGQRRMIPLPRNAANSVLAHEIGLEAAIWIASRFGGEEIAFPSPNGRGAETAAARLRADVLDAGLTDPTRSANDIAKQHRRSARRVEQIRQDLRAEAAKKPALRDLPLFKHD
jgi:hypothetical protein